MKAIIKASKIASLLVAMTVLHISCEDVVYHSFESTGVAWHKEDTLRYTYCSANAQEYSASVEICYNKKYPYRNLWIRREVEIASEDTLYADTLCCELYDGFGRNNGSTAGLRYQLSTPGKHFLLQDGDTMKISLMHIMDDEAADGITDVGVKVLYSDQHRYGGN